MRLEMEESGTWKDCTGAILKLVKEANFEFGEDAVERRAANFLNLEAARNSLVCLVP